MVYSGMMLPALWSYWVISLQNLFLNYSGRCHTGANIVEIEENQNLSGVWLGRGVSIPSSSAHFFALVCSADMNTVFSHVLIYTHLGVKLHFHPLSSLSLCGAGAEAVRWGGAEVSGRKSVNWGQHASELLVPFRSTGEAKHCVEEKGNSS